VTDMKCEIRERKKNLLMKRDEALILINHSGKATPDRIQVLSEAAALLKGRPDNIIIDRIITHGGSTVSEAKVLSYSRKEDIPEWRLKKMERRVSKIKGRPNEEPKPAPDEKPAEGESSREGGAAQNTESNEKPPEQAGEESRTEPPVEGKKDEAPESDAEKKEGS